MWQAAVQLNGVCVKAGKKGKNPAIGESLRFFVPLYRDLCFNRCWALANPVFRLNALGEKMQLSIDVRGIWPTGGSAVLNGIVGSGDGNVSTS